jgi:hypothetical protein
VIWLVAAHHRCSCSYMDEMCIWKPLIVCISRSVSRTDENIRASCANTAGISQCNPIQSAI